MRFIAIILGLIAANALAADTANVSHRGVGLGQSAMQLASQGGHGFYVCVRAYNVYEKRWCYTRPNRSGYRYACGGHNKTYIQCAVRTFPGGNYQRCTGPYNFQKATAACQIIHSRYGHRSHVQ